jgi:hypothetical protein
MNYILWKVSWINLKMMIADAPRYESGTHTKRGKPLETEDEIAEFLA